jgi:hypothetical protein
MRPVHRRAAAGLLAALLVALVPTAPSGATADPPSLPAADRAIAYLRMQQLPSGGFDGDVVFEGTTFPASDFATSEAVLAIAEHAQSTTTWSAATARAAVQAFTRDGRSPLAFLDTDVTTSVSAGKAAKMIVLVAMPLGLDPRAFDPAGDGSPVDLVARMDSGLQPNGSYATGALNATLFAMLANRQLGRPVADTTIAYLRATQQANGAWSFDADPAGTTASIDTTARAVQALVASGVPTSDATLRRALQHIASNHAADGGWGDEDRVATTALVSIALEATGYPTVSRCWRDELAPALAGTPFVAPDAFIRSQQLASGELQSPFGGSFTTAQAVQGMLRGWQPGSLRVAGSSCPSSGYRIVGEDGGVFSYGTSRFAGSAAGVSNLPIVDALTTRSGNGYLLIATDGGVFAYGDGVFRGSTGSITLNQPIVTSASTPTGGGYWLFAADGGVFAYGDARFYGSAAGVTNDRIVAAAATTTGGGYWLFAEDGGVFAYGDAVFRGSAAGTVTAPIVAGAARPQGDGYALFTARGQVLPFGYPTSLELPAPLPAVDIVDGMFSADGLGTYLLGSDGGVFASGAPFLGSAAGVSRSTAVAITG